MKAAQQILCNTWPDHPCVGDSFAVDAKATSGLPVHTSVLAGPAMIVDNRVTLLRPGEVKIKVTQSGNEEFEAAPEVLASLNVTKANQTIVFDPLPGEIFSGDRIPLKALATSQLPVTFQVLAGPAELSGGRVAIITGPGLVEIEASQTGNDKFLASKAKVSFTTMKRRQEILFTELQEGHFEEARFAVRATSSSGLPVSLSLVSGQARIKDNEATLTGAGPIVLKAAQLGDSCYTPAEAVGTFTPPKKRQSINFQSARAAFTVGEIYTLQGSATSGLPLTFHILSGNAILDGNQLIPDAIGAVTVKAIQAGNEAYEPAEAVQSFRVVKARQKLDFKALPKEAVVGDCCTLETIATAGLDVSYDIVSGNATISGDQLTLTAAGLVVIRALQAGNERYEPADAEQSLSVLKVKQTISLDGLPDEACVGQSIALRASAGSGLPVSLSVLSGPGEIVDDQLTLRDAGEVQLHATQAGDEKYAPAPAVVQTVTVVKAQQTIQFDLPSEQAQIGESILLTAKASSGQPITFRLLSGPAKLDGDTLVATGAGRVKVEAEQPGDYRYLAAKTQKSLLVVKRSQEILFEEFGDRQMSDPPFVINARATSDLPLSFSVVSGPAQIKDNQITLKGAGRVVIKAAQPGDGTYAPAEALRAFAVSRGRQTISFEASPGAVSVGDTITLRASASSGLPLSFSVLTGKASLVGNRLTPNAAGTLTIKATQAGNADYEPAKAVQSLMVVKARQTLHFKELPKELFVGDCFTLEAAASSGLTAVLFSVVSGAANISGHQLTLTAAGSVVLKAVQAGNEKFDAAEAEQTISVLKAKQTIRFDGLPREAIAGQSLPFRATVGSRLPVAVVVLSGPAEIVDDQLRLKAAGEVKIKATQEGNENHAAAPEIIHTLAVARAPQTIHFDLPDKELQIGESLLLAATATSGQQVTFRFLSGPGKLEGNTFVGAGVGQVKIEAEQPGDDQYLPAKVQRSLSVVKRSQELRFAEVKDRKMGELPFVVSARATSGLPVSFSVVSGPAKIRENEVTLTGAGRVVLQAAQAGDDSYVPAEAACSFSVGKGRQTIAFDAAPASLSVGDTITLRASASSGLPPSFSVLNGKASLAGNRLTLNAAGALSIKATQIGNQDYEPTEALLSFAVAKAKQKLVFKALPQQPSVGDRCTLEAVASSGLTSITFSVASGMATISGDQLMLTAAGSVAIKAAQPGNEKFEAAEAQQTISVLKAKQTIRFEGLPREAAAGESLPLRATAESGLPVSISVLSGPAEIVDRQLRLQAAGEVKLKAIQPGDENHAPAPELIHTVTVVKARQTIRFELPAAQRQIGESIVLSATASSGQPVTFRLLSGPAKLDGHALVGTGAGRVEIEAVQEGNEKYLVAKTQRSLLVVKRSQEILFQELRDLQVGEPPFIISATASSGLPVSFSVVSGPAQIELNEVTLTGAGSVVIKAAQAGDESYVPAEVVRTFSVGKGRQTIDFDAAPAALCAGDAFTLQASASSGLPLSFSVVTGEGNLVGDRLTAEAAGTVTIKATQAGNEDYEPVQALQSFTVEKAAQKLVFKTVPKEVFVGDCCTLEAVASSGLTAVTFRVVSGTANISGHQLTLTDAGPVVIKAVQAGNEKFEAAEAEQTISVLKAKQTIRFDGLPREATAGQSLPLRARVSSGLPVSISVVSGPAEIVNAQLTLQAAGEVKLKATQVGDANHAPAPEVVHTLSVAKAPQTVRFEPPAQGQIGESILLSATASSGQPITFRLLSGPAKLDGNSLVGTGTGRVEIEAEQAGDGMHLAAKTQRSLLVVKRSQEIVFDELNHAEVSEARFNINARATSGLPVSFSIVSGPAQIKQNEITLTGAGRVVIRAAQAGDNTYAAAEAIHAVSVGRLRQTIRFDAVPGPARVGDTIALQASSSSSLPLSFSVLSGEGRLTGNRLTPNAAGTLTIKATQTGNDDYGPAEAMQSLTVIKATQTLKFKALLKEIFVGDCCRLEAVASSGLTAVTFSVISGTAHIAGNQLTLSAAGSVVIKATQPGNEKFDAAEAEQTISVLKAKQTIRFDGLPREAAAGETLALRATAGSRLPVQIVVLSGPAEIVDGQLRLHAPGEVKLKATQPGDENHAAAPEIVHTLAVAKATQTIRFDLPDQELPIGESMLLEATASSSQPVTFRLLSGPAKLDGHTLVGTGAGRVEIEAEQQGTDKYLAAKIQRSLLLVKRSQELVFDEVRDRKMGEPPFVVSARASSGLPVRFSVVSGPAKITGNEIALTGAGRVVLKAAQAGDDSYFPAEAACSFSVGKQRQTIAFDAAPGALSVGDTITLRASSSSGLPLSFSVVTGKASVAGDRLTADSAGTLSIKATQKGNENYESAEALQSFTVAKAKQKLVFKALAKQPSVGDRCTLEAVASSGLTAVTFSVVSGTANVSGQHLTLTTAGSVVLKAAQPGNEKFEPAEAQQTISVLKAKQTISFEGLPREAAAGESLPLRATAGSGLPVGISVVSGPAEIADGQLILRGQGEVKLKATQSGNENYAPAPEVVQTLSVAKARQTIVFDLPRGNFHAGDSVILTAKASSGQPVTFRLLSGPAELYGDSLVGTAAGRVEIQAEQSGDTRYLAAKIKGSLLVVKRSQEIVFEELSDQKVSESALTLAAKATSGLPVTFRVASGPASISDCEVTLSGRGKVRIIASQAGNDIYEPAPEVQREFNVKDPARKTPVLVLSSLAGLLVLVVALFLFWPSRPPTPSPIGTPTANPTATAPPRTTPDLGQASPKAQQPPVASSNPQDDRERAFAQSMKDALEALRAGKFDAARNFIDQSLQQKQGDPAATALKTQIDAELSFASKMTAAQNALSRTNYVEAITQADAALAVKSNNPAAVKIKTDAQLGKQYQDSLKAAQLALVRRNYAEAISQADAALNLEPNEPEPAKLKLLAQQELTFDAATAGFKQGDYSAALSQSQKFPGIERFDRLTAQIGQEQSLLKGLQKALSDGNYPRILETTLPGKPPFDSLKAAATEENRALDQARQKLAAKDYSYIGTIERQSYRGKAPFAAVLEAGRKAQALEALRNESKTNVVSTTTQTASIPGGENPLSNPLATTTPTNTTPVTKTPATTTPPTVPTTVPAMTPAAAFAVSEQDKLLDSWEIRFGIKPRPRGSDVVVLRDPTKDSTYSLELFNKAENVYKTDDTLTPERQHRLNALRWVVSDGRKGEPPGFVK